MRRGRQWLDVSSRVPWPESLPVSKGFELLWNLLWNWSMPFSLYLNTAVADVGGIHRTVDELLEMLRKDCALVDVLLFHGRARGAHTPLSGADSCHHCVAPMTSVSPMTSLHCLTRPWLWPLPLWPSRTGHLCDSGIRLNLKRLKFFLGTGDLWSSREIVWTCLYRHRNLVQTSNFPVPFKMSRREHSIGWNSPRE